MNFEISKTEFLKIAGVAQLVERQPSKLNVAGSNPVSRSKVKCDRVQRRSALKEDIIATTWRGVLL